jgi:hypothetical protein
VQPGNIVRFEVEKISDGAYHCQPVSDNPKDGYRLTGQIPVVKITVTGEDGTVLADIWTRDQFVAMMYQAMQIISDS